MCEMCVKQMFKCVKLHNSKVHISGSQLTSPDLTIKANFKFIFVQCVDHLVQFILERYQLNSLLLNKAAGNA